MSRVEIDQSATAQRERESERAKSQRKGQRPKMTSAASQPASHYVCSIKEADEPARAASRNVEMRERTDWHRTLRERTADRPTDYRIAVPTATTVTLQRREPPA